MINIKFFLVVFVLFSHFSLIFGQKQICKCELISNYGQTDYKPRVNNSIIEINRAIENIEEGRYKITSESNQESIFNQMLKPFSEILPPYSVKYETNLTNFLPSGWVEDDPGIFNILFIKKPFNTYIDEQKNFDVMFGLSTTMEKKKSPFIVVKNYFENSQYQSLGYPKLIIDDYKFTFHDAISGYGKNYQEQTMSLKSGVNVVAYRTVRLYRINFNTQSGFQSNGEQLVSDVISKIKPGKVFMVYETSTGQIKRTFTEAQVKSLKEMLQIYEKFQFNKWDVTYLNEQVKKECQDMEAQVSRDNEEHYIRLKPIEEKINDIMEKYRKF